MPFVQLPPVSKETRLSLAEGRWTAMLRARPDLGPAVALQRQLMGHVLDLTDTFDGARPARLSLPPRYVTTKLAAGIPALSGEPLQLPVDALKPTLVNLCRSLARGGGGEATRLIQRAVEEGQLNAAALLTLGLRREQGALRAVATRAGLGHDLLWLVVDLTVSPLAHALLQAIFGGLPADSPVASALNDWSRGYCALCGSWPTLVEDVADARRLRCSLCAAAWELTAGSCLYCGNASETFVVHAPDPAQPGRVVETCGACRGYAKAIQSDGSLPFPLVALADLESMDLDLAAMQKGCARPALKQFGRR